jgi:hypothetical protein
LVNRIEGPGFIAYSLKTYTGPLMLTTSKSDDAPTVELAKAYNALYDYFNHSIFEKVFGQPLPRPILNFSRQKNAVAVFYANSWKDPMTGDVSDEISLVPEWTGRDPRDVLSSMVHEMAHYKDKLDGTTPKTPGYHGRTWFKIMERIGLPPRPLSKTMLSVSHTIDPDGIYAKAFETMPKSLTFPFVTARPVQYAGKKNDNLSGKRARYECPSCGLIARAPSQKNLICGDCDMPLGETGF